MIIKQYDSKEEWLENRAGRITGTKLDDVVVKRGTGKKMGFYQLVADRIALPPDPDESPMDRGHRLEQEGLEMLSTYTGVPFIHADNLVWFSDDNQNIAASPDGYTEDLTIACEIKCPGSAKYLMYMDLDVIPHEYEFQVLQLFIVNERLEKLYFGIYDDRIAARPLHVVEVTRKELGSRVEQYKEYQINLLKDVDNMVALLAF